MSIETIDLTADTLFEEAVHNLDEEAEFLTPEQYWRQYDAICIAFEQYD